MQIHFIDQKGSILDVSLDERSDVYGWGSDNAFPSLIEVVTNNSVTASATIKKVAKAIYGKGFNVSGSTTVNKDGQTLNEVLRISARELAKHGNVFFNIGYNGELKAKSIKVIPNSQIRVGKSDDWGYSGKFLIYDNWDKSKGQVKYDQFQVIDKYNPSKEVTKSQIEKAGSMLKYKGQILHLKSDSNQIYSLPDCYPVLSEMVLEANSALFRSQGAKEGFLNNKIIKVRPFSNDEDRRKFKRTIENLQGANGTGRVFVFESGTASEDLSKEMIVEDLTSNFNDKIFAYSDSQARKNIAIALGVPLQLIDVESGMFGNSGELLKSAQSILFQSRDEERDMLLECFNKIFSNWKETIPQLEIINPYEEVKEDKKETPKDVNAEAQATLKGSVGGVQALLSIQQSVGAGTTDLESAVVIIQNIFGYSEETARKMIGTPKTQAA